MNKTILKIALVGLLTTTMFSCKYRTDIHDFTGPKEKTVLPKDSNSDTTVPQVPQITKINKSPDKLTKDDETYTVTLVTEGEKETLQDMEFSMDGKYWQNIGEFKDVKGGKHTFYARNKRDRSLQDKKEMYFEPFVEIQIPTNSQLNEYLKQIANYDEMAIDNMRKCLGNDCCVKGVENIKNVQELIMDITIKGTIYSVTNIEMKDGYVISISINKK